MPRRAAAKNHRREVQPDAVYNNRLVTQLINKVLLDGKKSTAERIVYGAFDIVAEKSGEDALTVFKKAMDNVRPTLEVKPKRVGGATYQVPMEVNSRRATTLAIRWIVNFSRARKEKTMAERLANEILDASNGVGASIKKREDLFKMAEANRAVPMVGRTHLQPAMPSSVAMWASGYAEMLLDDAYLLEAAYRANDLCPLGSAAGYGVPLPIDRQLTSDLLAFARPFHNVFYASCARGKDEAILLCACAQVMLSLSRLAEDLILFSMPEFRYFTLPRDLCTGSSIMPQKYNPDVLELIRAKAALLLGQSAAANTILKALPGGYNRDLQDTKELYMEGLRVTRASLRIMRLMAQNLTVNPERCRAAFDEPGVFATDRALELVAQGMPFRDAYHQVRDHLEDLRGMDPDAVIAKKTHLGGTNGLDLAGLRARADALAADAAARQARIDAAFAALMNPAD